MTMTPGTRRGHPTKTEYTSIMASVQLHGMTRPMIVTRKLSVVSENSALKTADCGLKWQPNANKEFLHTFISWNLIAVLRSQEPCTNERCNRTAKYVAEKPSREEEETSSLKSK
jgi:hypothetical protein